MALSTPVCGVCDLRNISKPPITWCNECDEGLCVDCQDHHSLSKGTRHHNTTPITEYLKLPSDILQITENCDKHNERYVIYCKKHECPCCSSCIVENHSECRDLAKLADIVQNIKTSNAFYEIEHSLTELAENIKTIRQNRQNNLKTLSEKKMKILQEIKETRNRINNHLDKIQDDTINTLNLTEEKESRQIEVLLTQLKGKENEVSKCQRNMEKIRQHATDLQTFVSMKQLEKNILTEEQLLRSMVKTRTSKESRLSYQVNTAIQKFITEIQSFGEVKMQTKPCAVELTWKKEKQAQIIVPRILSRSIENITLRLHKTINSIGNNIMGCCTLPDGRIAFTDYSYSTVRIFNSDGSKDFEVKTPNWAFDIAYSGGDNTLAVTSGPSRKFLEIIDLQNKKIKESISIDYDYYGIALRDNKFICSAAGKGIQLTNLHNNSTIDLVQTKLPPFCYVASFGDKIYHTDYKSSSVTCSDLKGTALWSFKNESALKNPLGLSTDNYGNVYVVGESSKNVVVISADGQQHKEILTASHGFSDTTTLSFNRSSNQLLVANRYDKAILFSLN
ncbi:uncharacterized protein LOC127704155 [Mytilus californianus]|uniref:uncharacterized protein LOC127704155 n=1 Tax=Mytilus californianus TaxID=6549 RepID=UPI002245D757|nr:uncharacterized protein LOC127704155 [Mytilus californianus]